MTEADLQVPKATAGAAAAAQGVQAAAGSSHKPAAHPGLSALLTYGSESDDVSDSDSGSQAAQEPTTLGPFF